MNIPKKIILILSLVIIFVLGFYAGKSSISKYQYKDESTLVYALVGGEKIMGSDVLSSIQSDLNQLENNIYEIKKNAVAAFIRKKFNLPDNERLVKNDDWKKTEISELELEKFLSIRNLKKGQLSPKDLENILNNMKFQKYSSSKKDIEKKSFEDLKVVWKIPIPTLPVLSIKAGSMHLSGNDKSPVQIIAIGNFHCPNCQMAREKLMTLRTKYKDNLKLSFRFTMDEAPDSIVRLSAEALYCAKEQNAQLVFFDKILTPETLNSKRAIIETAMKLKMDVISFESCLEERKYKSEIQTDIDFFKDQKLGNQPYLVINDLLIPANDPIDNLTRTIDSMFNR